MEGSLYDNNRPDSLLDEGDEMLFQESKLDAIADDDDDNIANRLYDTGGDGEVVTVASVQLEKMEAQEAAANKSRTLAKLTRKRSIGDSGTVSAKYLGQAVKCKKYGPGILRFVGPSLKDGETIAGVELDTPVGYCDGADEVCA
jgi:hypothetical protein